MNTRERNVLDRYITGDYGERQFAHQAFETETEAMEVVAQCRMDDPDWSYFVMQQPDGRWTISVFDEDGLALGEI